VSVQISRNLANAINQQIANEFGASMQYLSIAAHFHQRHLTMLAKLFFDQADEERQHAMKLVKYLVDAKGALQIPAVPAAKATFASAEEAAQAAYDWELEVTKQINGLMEIAQKENDYLAQGFLQWFVDEQLEEINKMERVLAAIKSSGERNLLMVEAYLVHIEKS
jgi:bacterioferritin B